MNKAGRNDPCPCGSGKKYKKCCLHKDYSPPGREQSIASTLTENVLKFSKKHYRDSIEDAFYYFWDDFNPQEYLDEGHFQMAEVNFWEWFIYDWQPDERNGKTLIELYMEDARRLSAEETDILKKMNGSVLSLYEVQEVYPGKGLLLKDLLLGGEFDVKEKRATEGLRTWDILAARLQRYDGTYIMSGAIYGYPIRAKKALIAYVKECARDYRKNNPGATLRDFLKQNSDLFNYYWYDLFRDPIRPTLVTTGGEPMLFSTAVFKVTDEDAAVSGLRKIPAFEEIENERFKWLDEPKSDGSATILGDIKIEDKTLKLVCTSKERLEKGKVLLLEKLGGSIAHKIDMFQDPFQAMKAMPDAPAKPDTGITKEKKQEIYDSFMKDYYEGWLNKRLPALKGQTPLEAAKHPREKKRVAEILKSIENTEEKHKQLGEPYFDPSWLWERLGIER